LCLKQLYYKTVKFVQFIITTAAKYFGYLNSL